MHLVGESERTELDPVRAERVRLDHVCARPDVRLMDVGDEIRLGQIQLVERTIQEHTPRVQHRAHRPVTHEDAGVERGKKRALSS